MGNESTSQLRTSLSVSFTLWGSELSHKGRGPLGACGWLELVFFAGFGSGADLPSGSTTLWPNTSLPTNIRCLSFTHWSSGPSHKDSGSGVLGPHVFRGLLGSCSWFAAHSGSDLSAVAKALLRAYTFLHLIKRAAFFSLFFSEAVLNGRGLLGSSDF